MRGFAPLNRDFSPTPVLGVRLLGNEGKDSQLDLRGDVHVLRENPKRVNSPDTDVQSGPMRSEKIPAHSTQSPQACRTNFIARTNRTRCPTLSSPPPPSLGGQSKSKKWQFHPSVVASGILGPSAASSGRETISRSGENSAHWHPLQLVVFSNQTQNPPRGCPCCTCLPLPTAMSNP